jgi:hypothetical protein
MIRPRSPEKVDHGVSPQVIMVWMIKGSRRMIFMRPGVGDHID